MLFAMMVLMGAVKFTYIVMEFWRDWYELKLIEQTIKVGLA